MGPWMRKPYLSLVCAAVACLTVGAESGPTESGPAESGRLETRDVFELEFASDPQISPDGARIVYVRNGFDIMTDRGTADLWMIDIESGLQRPLGSGPRQSSSPRWSPDGSKLVFVGTDDDDREQIFLRWIDTGQTTKISRLLRSPSGLSWSPDGSWIAFSMFVPEETEPFATMPKKPEGAAWAPAARTVERLFYRSDGSGFLETGFTQLFVLPTEGGTPRQLTSGPFHHRGPVSWRPDGQSFVFSANRRENWEYEPQNTEIYELRLQDSSVRALTDRLGPDSSPVVSADGKRIAYLGYDDHFQGYQVTDLYVLDGDGSPRNLTASLDRSVSQPRWSADGERIFVSFSDEGNGKIASISPSGEVEILASDLGGLSLGRPYGGGAYSVGPKGALAYTVTTPDHPADIAWVTAGAGPKRMTRLNDDLFGHKELGAVEEIWWTSSYDERRIQGWIVKPPGFDPSRKYPLILEIHGGPFADYGDRFSVEIQLYAAAGYVVLYCNPRGSTSYGEEFGNLIHHAYPSYDFDDLMSGVDGMIDRAYVDAQQLFVTGGSGGGVLSSWIVGHTERFAAAAVQKPVINWYSWVLTADIATTYKYWFPALPWEDPEHYLERSPISYVGNVSTPTMLITGEVDYRTPMSESEQYYQALKLLEVPAALVRIPEASHGIAARPSHLIAKVVHVLAWFERYRRDGGS